MAVNLCKCIIGIWKKNKRMIFFFKFCIFMIIKKFPLYYKCAIYFELCWVFFTKQTRQNKMNCELMLTYDTPALRQTGSRNLMGPKTPPTIWDTYMKLVTKYQISAINSC